jgi:hypothetical protein
MDMIPHVWCEKREMRDIEVTTVLGELGDFVMKNPDALTYLIKKVNVLRNQGPYADLTERCDRFIGELFKCDELQHVISANLLD